ncbi:MAG: ABC transporter ATP-binding protein [Candidatus Abyssobacteria bacterium SURF_5]|uniref:ABC transporter ATP-binding protein n=1 Tax=Abyssobacteria bacterium (strain SURF_5) TaxID=2093360 RepID=A0A3A4NJ45_ABYX5|nr:MAG: ABC transporter ATP-binding protein [Candidatus Abyssubacteria bacterium SURF_5]
MAFVEIENISKSFGKQKRVLEEISFQVPDHTFFTLLGPSGCGKSTLLKIIAGLEVPDRGTVRIAGRDVTELSPARRNIAMVFQSYALYPHLSVFRNIATPLKLRRVPQREIERRVRETAELLRITEHLEKRPGPLSGGERQRVALARALVREPEVFLMDEPLSNLDALLRERTRVELKMLFLKLRATVIYVTHDQVEAMAMSDVIAVLNEGRIQQAGPPMDIYGRPANEFVAGFVGSPRMNFFAVSIRNRKIHFEKGQTVPVPPQFRAISELPEQAALGFRPEDARLEEGGMEFTGEIRAVEELGPQSVIVLHTREGDARIVLAAMTKKSGPLKFSVPHERIHLFRRPGGESVRPA